LRCSRRAMRPARRLRRRAGTAPRPDCAGSNRTSWPMSPIELSAIVATIGPTPGMVMTRRLGSQTYSAASPIPQDPDSPTCCRGTGRDPSQRSRRRSRGLRRSDTLGDRKISFAEGLHQKAICSYHVVVELPAGVRERVHQSSKWTDNLARQPSPHSSQPQRHCPFMGFF
jgi:hypothetical protein